MLRYLLFKIESGLKTLTNSSSRARWVFLLLTGLFLGIGIAQVFLADIGTDEGNVLYTIDLIVKQHLTLYTDVWGREPGSVFLLAPFFTHLDTSILHFRVVIFLINACSFAMVAYTARTFFGRRMQLLAATLCLFLYPALFNIYSGAFYQCWILFALIIFHLLLLYAKNASKKTLLAIGLLTGCTTLVYKGGEILLAVVPVWLFLQHLSSWKPRLLRTLLFFASAALPLFLFFGFFAWQTNPMHIYNIILYDIVIIYAVTIVAALILVGSAEVSKIKSYLSTGGADILVYITNLGIIGALALLFITDRSAVAFFAWGGLHIEAFYIFIPLLCLNLLLFSGWKRYSLFVGYAIIVSTLFVFGFGSRGFFQSVPLSQHAVFLFFAGLFFLWLGQLVFRKSTTALQTPTGMFIAAAANLLFLGSLFGSYLSPARIIIIAPIFFILFALAINAVSSSTDRHQAAVFASFCFVFLLLTNGLYLTRPTDYTLYSYRAVEDVASLIERTTKPNDLIFTVDPAVAAHVPRQNLIAFTSPWIFRNTNDLFYSYNGMAEQFPTDMSMSKNDILNRLLERKPAYIVGNVRTTIQTFFVDETDANNTALKYILERHYHKITTIESIHVYKKKAAWF